ncbi:MAG TPA: phage tail tape measure protein, partial [Acetobacteraceae bacterium]
MSDVLADLYILLRAESGRMVTGFAEGGAAGEEMAASIAAATAEVETRTAAMDAAVTSIGAAATDAAAVTAAGFTEVGLTAEQLATKIAVVSADVEAEIVALDTSLISIGQAADDAALANAAAMEKMRADTIAALTAMETAEAQAAASTEAMAAKIDAAAASSTATTAGKMQALKTGALAVGVAAALVAGGSIKMAADFESATNRLVTSAGETEANLDGVRQGILSLAGQVGYSSEDLAAAMYKIESGGQHGAAGLDVLKASAQGAKAENADLTTVADAVTSVLQDYHLQASASADVTSKLVAATAAGKMTFEELSGSLSSVLPVASANHVALEDILGDISSMTVHGMSASQVTQNLSDTIRHMAAPTQQQSKELAALGMNAQQLSSDLGENGLYGVVQNISQAIVQRFSPDMQHVVISLKDALSKSTPAVQELGQKLLDGTMSAKQ